MGKRNSRIDSLSDDDLYKKWQADLDALKNRAYRLASAEETFRQTRSVAQVSPVLAHIVAVQCGTGPVGV